MRAADVPAELLAIADATAGFGRSTGGSVATAIAAIITRWEAIKAERDNGSPQPENLHWCGDACVCLIHGIPLYYSSDLEGHACQDPGCPFAHGYETELARTWDELASNTATIEQFGVKMARLLGLPTGTPIDETLTMFTQQYCSLQLAAHRSLHSAG